MQGISRQTDYAARVVLHLAALGPGAQVQVKEIAARRLLPRAFVRRVVARLAAAGILRTVRGQRGGVSLARSAGAITLLDIVQSMEGGIVLNRCVSTPRACPLAVICPVQRAWTDATRTIERQLAGVTFARLATAAERTVSATGYQSRRRSSPSSRPARRSCPVRLPARRSRPT